MTFKSIGELAGAVLLKAELRVAARQDTAANEDGGSSGREGTNEPPMRKAKGGEAAQTGERKAGMTVEVTPAVVRREVRGLKLVSSRDGRAALPHRGRFAPSAARQPLVLVVDNSVPH
jgi:hypothetical protein